MKMIIAFSFVIGLFILVFTLIRLDFKLTRKIFPHKQTFIVYWLLRFLVGLPLIGGITTKNYEVVMLCVMALLLFLLPSLIERRFKIALPKTMEIVILFFIYAHAILGEIGAFYVRVTWWDTMLHTLSGFLLAAIGFSLVELLNESPKISLQLSPFYVAFVAVCFSLSIGVVWEFIEYSADRYLNTDMQKDMIVDHIDSVYLDENKSNIVVHVKDIEKTVVYTKDGEVVIEDGYLDVGIHDTIKDLFVCFVGSIVFSTMGYFYIKGINHRSIAKYFIPKRNW